MNSRYQQSFWCLFSALETRNYCRSNAVPGSFLQLCNFAAKTFQLQELTFACRNCKLKESKGYFFGRARANHSSVTFCLLKQQESRKEWISTLCNQSKFCRRRNFEPFKKFYHPRSGFSRLFLVTHHSTFFHPKSLWKSEICWIDLLRGVWPFWIKGSRLLSRLSQQSIWIFNCEKSFLSHAIWLAPKHIY